MDTSNINEVVLKRSAQKWKGDSLVDYQKPAFAAKEYNNSIHIRAHRSGKFVIRIWTEERSLENGGAFPDRNCLLVDSLDKTLAKVRTKKDEVVGSKDGYQVVVKEVIDGAIVCGIVAVLDDIHGESTSC